MISDVSINITEIDSHVTIFDYDITFASIMDVSKIQVYSWDTKRNALIFTIENAITVTQGTTQSILENSLDIIRENNAPCDTGQLLLDDGSCMDAEPVMDAEPISEESKCGRETKTVNGICVVIIQEQSWFDRLFSWLSFR